ncbi:MAG: hypothetical protein LBS46_03425 [Dysgonamonadaceae bacterium]|jgi:hypothetical protein|nr:hypothetical protein [Dysgonamonadaceae bacterium]
MSYSKRYHERIAIHYSGSVSYRYPASQNGGSGSAHYSGTVYEDVNVNINVDTNPFDRSVSGCKTSVNALTGAVVATETAQIASIDKNSKKVANTIVSGFFDYIRSDISQQIMELSQKIDAHLLHMRELAKNCASKQKQMETDYNRISTRYLKIFDDLNNELENRIFELDKPAFVFKRGIDSHSNRTSDNDLVSTVAVFGREGGELQAKISASVAKKRALDAINQANIFLWKQKKLQSTINQSMLNESATATRFSPVCFVETSSEQDQIGQNVYHADFLPKTNSNELIEKFQTQSWANGTKEQKNKIQRYFNSEVSNAYNSANQHEERVKNMLVKIFNINSIQFA